ncbi:hypothetical protein KFE25_004083 [Diacronema lutheri]|uniref:Major facilitator superfamily (MFS) profile domain-containing protein n=1 Tax=Diacronema lutheri TaxID=2081491 RepID=A0A8J5XQW3_DIALT|nr:hypothetical protein KFE25_004083 [Diacronema lutheri]
MSWLGALMAPPRAAGPPPDGGSAAWLRLAAYWLVCAGTLGLQYTSGLLLVELLAEFGKGRAQTAIVGSASTGVMDFFGFFVGDVIVRLGERSTCLVGALLAGLGIIASAHATELWHLYITFSIVVGIGHSCALFAGIIVNNKWFLRRRAITSAIGNTGGAAGPFLIAPLWGLAVRSLGWRGVLRVLGACDVALLVCAALPLTPPPPPLLLPAPDVGAQSASGAPSVVGATPPVTAREVMRNREVRRLAVVIGLYGLGSWVPVVHLVAAGRDQGLSAERADSLVLYIAAGSVGLRVPINALADRFGRRRLWLLVALLYALVDLVAPFVWGSYPLLCAYAVLAGGFTGGLNSLMVALAPEVSTPEHMAHATTISTATLGLGTFSGPVIAGAIFDARGSYVGGWVFAAACLVLSALTLVLPASLFGAPGHGELRVPAGSAWRGCAPRGEAHATAETSESRVGPVKAVSIGVHQ